ncbi:MAG: hypothetical protein FJ143_00375 [Deltaproteobacteria bacterium]|nr:hypothetical protein [Deltaproteobacteria bacterium]
MEKEDLPLALKNAQAYGIDLTLLYERLSWTPTERIEKHSQNLEFANELRKAGEEQRGRSQGRRPSQRTE